mmetsp:Transcript_52174/g.93571  ORF Transcript_52174/g.93571 Transcript_52174/m.93571 type:complete len:895 (+) Transcript_52174:75-2759(+)
MLRACAISCFAVVSLVSGSTTLTTTTSDASESDLHLDPYNSHSKYARNSRITIEALAGVSVALVIAMYAYQVWSRRKSEKAAQKLEMLKSTDQTLVKILQNFSIKQLDENKFRGISRKLETASLGFSDIRCSVKCARGEITVLENISGCFFAGNLSAIMGPSGTGKTTLIDVLTGKKHTDSKWTVEGQVFINGTEQQIKVLKPVMGFVPQDDLVHEGLTVRENISFSAAMRLPKGTSTIRMKKVTDDVLQVLQLEPKQNMIVGNRTLSGEGLSGGQKKRVNVGLELAACPTILFLDEPTSGLDATASLMLVTQLKRMAELGMTVIMIIHQPRYSLFTQIDDTLLLGLHEGGRCFYMGPSKEAKLHFEMQGLKMPENENPADWMMDVLCGQIDQKDSRIPKSQLAEQLCNVWKNNPYARKADSQRRRGSRLTTRSNEDDDVEIIMRHCKESWTAVLHEKEGCDRQTFPQVLKECTGIVPGDDIASGIFRRTLQFSARGITDDLESLFQRANTWRSDSSRTSGDDHAFVCLPDFIKFLLNFRGLSTEALSSHYFRHQSGMQSSDGDNEESTTDESGEEETGEDDDEEGETEHDGFWRVSSRTETGGGSTDLHRIQPGFCVHFRVTWHSALISFWRKLAKKMAFLGVVCFAAAFLAFFDNFIFKSPPWLATTFINAQISLALLVSVYCLQVFSHDQAMYWREASHGLHRGAFFLGRSLVDTIDWMLMTFFFVLVYYLIVNPVLQFYYYIWPFVLVSYVASGWGYCISTCLPTQYGPFISCLLSFTMGGILGLPTEMGVFLNGGFLEVMVDSISFTRWSGAMSFLCFIQKLPPADAYLNDYNRAMLQLFKTNYEQASFLLNVEDSAWWTGILALTIQGTVLRVVAWCGLRFTNRDRQI